jgi:Ran-binding protein 3
MADKADASRRSPSPPERIKPSSAEDPDTAAARKEFDNAAISEKPNLAAMSSTTKDNPAAEPVSAGDKAPEKTPTSDDDIVDAQHDKLKEQISSPKKKRAHAEVDESRETPQDLNGDVSPLGANGNSSLSRTNRSEPEKKRHRDISSETKEDKDSTVSSTWLLRSRYHLTNLR